MRILAAFLLLVASNVGVSFMSYNRWVNRGFPKISASRVKLVSMMTHHTPEIASAQAAPGKYIRPSIIDKARTITHICTSGTLCTTSVAPEMEGFPFGSYVDFITDENGWPILLISNQSLHTQNIQHSPAVSLFCQLPKQTATQASASLSRVTIMGHIEKTPEDELPALQMAFTLIHPYSEQLFNSPKFSLLRLKPAKIFFSGGFGVSATWVDVKEYESARADVLANEMPIVLAKVNLEKQGELLLVCKHFLGLQDVEKVRVQTIDRLGMDLRIKSGGDLTDEYRVGFRHAVNSAEEAKSEMVKLFQEAWEREKGCYYSDDLPLVTKYAEDIIRKGHSGSGEKSAFKSFATAGSSKTDRAAV